MCRGCSGRVEAPEPKHQDILRSLHRQSCPSQGGKSRRHPLRGKRSESIDQLEGPQPRGSTVTLASTPTGGDGVSQPAPRRARRKRDT